MDEDLIGCYIERDPLVVGGYAAIFTYDSAVVDYRHISAEDESAAHEIIKIAWPEIVRQLKKNINIEEEK